MSTGEVIRPLVHIGYPRTGSTWLQDNVFFKREMGFHLAANENEVKRELIGPNPLDFDAGACREFFEPRLASTPAGLVPVITAERLSGNPDSGGYDSKEIASRLAAVFPGALILLVIREQTTMLISRYKGYVERGGAGSVEHFFHPRAHSIKLPLFDFGHFRYDRLIAHYQETFGPDNLLVLPYELFFDDPRRYVEQIVSFSGAPATTEAIGNLPHRSRVKPSLSALSVVLMRPLNALLVWDATRDSPPALVPTRGLGWRLGYRMTWGAIRRLRSLDPLVPHSLHGGLEARMAREVRAVMGHRYVTSNRRTAKVTGLDLRRFGYQMEKVGKGERPSEGSRRDGPVHTSPRSPGESRGWRPCSRETSQCDFWLWGSDEVRPDCCTAHLKTLTFFADELLSRHGITHWLDWGALLGAVRSGEMIPWDKDVDFGVLAEDADRIASLRREVKRAGYHLVREPFHFSIRLSAHNRLAVDLYMWERRDGLLAMRQAGPSEWPGLYGRNPFPAAYLDSLEPVELYRKPLPAPSPAHDFLLEHRYGPDYMTPRRPIRYKLYPDIRPEDATPLVRDLIARIGERQQHLARLRERSRFARFRFWRRWGDPGLPVDPAPEFSAPLEAEVGDAEQGPITKQLIHSLARFDQAIAEVVDPLPRLWIGRESRRTAELGRGVLKTIRRRRTKARKNLRRALGARRRR